MLQVEEAPLRLVSQGGTRLTERDLWKLWEGQRFPASALVTGWGARLRVIYRGRAGAGPGPDFRDAIIAAPWGLLQGDVELHVRAGDFRRHGHHLDPAYDRVILHLVFEDEAAQETVLHSGASIPVVALGRWTGIRGHEIQDWLSAPARWQEPCRSAVTRLGAGEAGAALDRLGRMRFRQKTVAWRRRLAAGGGAEQALWCGLLEGLGYGGEREAFRRLAAVLPWRQLRLRLHGFRWAEAEAEAGSLLRRDYGLLEAPPSVSAGMRPGNRPQRRLAGAAVLAARYAQEGIAAWLLGPLGAENPLPGMLSALTVAGLIGRPRAVEIAANAVLPIAAALCTEPASRRIEALFAELPLPARYGAVRHLHAALAGEVPLSMQRQQGMLYLLGQYCTRGGCGRCPLS